VGNSPIDRLLHRLAELVTRKRLVIVLSTLALTGVFAAQIPKIKVDPAPENLLSASDEEGARTTQLFKEAFGDSSHVLLVLLTSDNVLSGENLAYQHALTQGLVSIKGIERIESLTDMNLPRIVEPPTTDDDALDAAEGDDLEDLEDLDDLDALDDEDVTSDFDAVTTNAMIDLIESDPVRFPGGLQTVGPRLKSTLRFEPIAIDGELPEDAEVQLRLAIDQSPLLVGRLISEDRTAAAVALFLAELSGREMPRLVDAVEGWLAENPAPEGSEVHLAGLPYVRSTIVERIRADQILLVPVTMLVCMAILYIAMRWLGGVVLTMFAVGVIILMVLGGMALADEPLNILNNIIPPLLIIIGVSDSIHVLARYRDELGRGADKKPAGFQAVKSLAVATFFTGVTTSIGLGSLVAARTEMLRHFGITAAIGVMIAYFVTIFFVPPLMISVAPPAARPRTAAARPLESAMVLLTARVLRNPWPIVVITLALLLGAAGVASRIRVDHALLDQFSPNDPVYVSTQILESKLDGVRPLEIMVHAEDPSTLLDPEFIAGLEEVQAWAREKDEVIRTMSYSSILDQSLSLLANDPTVWAEPFKSPAQVKALADLFANRKPNPLLRYLSEDRTLARVQVMLRDAGAQKTIRFIDELERKLTERFGGSPVTFRFTGDAYTGSRVQQAVVSDLLTSLLAAVLIIFVLLSALFRSVRLGLLSIPPNLIPLVGTLAYMVARDVPLNMSTVIIFSISFGLAVDGSIHVLARYREESKRGRAPNAALLRAARGTGRANVVSYATLMCGFGILLLSSFVPVRHFGELIAVTVASCLVATVFLLPALLKLFGQSREDRARADAERARLTEIIRRDRA
jgi:uncharacterized protein